MVCGIYQIRNKVNGKVYVGSSVNVRRRWVEHRRDLRRGNHYNQHLQRAWNKYGESSFEFLLVEECGEELLEDNENRWLQAKKPEWVYNLTEEVNGHRGAANPFFGRTHSHATRERMSVAKAGMYVGAANPNYGRTQSEATRRLMGERNQNRRLTDEDIKAIRELVAAGATHAETARKFSVNRNHVTQVVNGTKRQLADGPQTRRKHRNLTMDEIEAIEGLVASGMMQKDVAEKFGVARCTISCLLARMNKKGR